jgi:transcriptional regulator of acetoin/glycerol metabolism
LEKNGLNDRDKIWAWERFLTGEPDAAIPLGNVVVSSWQRSLKLGVNPAGRAAPIAAAGDHFKKLQHRNRDLLAAAAEFLPRMGEVFADANCMMLLTDPNGVVLDAVGDKRTLQQAERIHLVAGGKWDEAVIGTNGIGTALATRQPAQVHASEHFCEGIKSWTCAAAPVCEPGTGRILGVVDISGPPSTYQRGNLSLAVATARQIETALAECAGRERVRLLERCLTRLPSLGPANILVIDRSGRIVFGNGGQLLEPGQLVPGFDPEEPVEHWLARLPATFRAGDFDPITLNGRTVGAMIVIPQRKLKSPPAAADPFAAIIGESPAIRQMLARAKKLSARRVALLIQGETGVGKEVLVRAIHEAADAAAPCIMFNCGAASKELIASDMFGHVRGAYTGALQEGKPGRFELAHNGILCLDEIGELPLDLQPVLLRALEEGVVYRLGDATPRRFDVRLIAMTNRDLKAEVAAGRFRADLFYRISVTTINIPPLREREGDIALLLDHYNATLSARHNVPPLQYSAAARAALQNYAWPGNIRELRNFIEGLLLTAEPYVDLRDLPPEMAPTPPPLNAYSLDDLGRQAMQRAIAAANGNLTQAARKLGISRSTLHRRLGPRGLGGDPIASKARGLCP